MLRKKKQVNHIPALACVRKLTLVGKMSYVAF